MSEREKLKKLAEAATQGEWQMEYYCVSEKADPRNEIYTSYSEGDLQFLYRCHPSTILALLAELEQAERERDAARNCTVCTWCGEIQEHGGDWKTKVAQMFEHTEVCTKSPVKQLLNTKLELESSEAALRTLRQAATRLYNDAKLGGHNQALGKEYDVWANLAAALAAEGGK